MVSQAFWLCKKGTERLSRRCFADVLTNPQCFSSTVCRKIKNDYYGK